ncbi:head-tail connector protein [Brevundimonas sp.]|uniref:head-tail connector protein n=1 Tax=Brevundimonas sp. TaxID=1871086 RepID=UPI00391DC28C
MTAPVSMAEAKAFLRVTHDAEDELIALLIDAARKRVEGEAGVALTSTSPPALRLAVLMLTLRAYERGEDEMPIAPVEGWIAPYRQVRL